MDRRCVIFDLDGTLIDSREDLATGVNLTRKDFGLEPLSLDVIVSYVGDGVRKLCERALQGTGVTLDDALPHMRKHYGEHLLEKTQLYPGVAETLQQLQKQGCELAILTNKPIEHTRRLADNFKITGYFREVIGFGSGFALKPDPEAIAHLLAVTGCKADHAYMVGDHHTDMEAGRRAGVNRVFAEWGFGNLLTESFEFSAKTFPELAEKLAKL